MAAERRIVVAPGQLRGARLRRLRLAHPRTGTPCSFYVHAETETVLEAARIDLSGQRSWLGSGWVSGPGVASVLTPVDPLFLFLSLLTAACSRGDEWRFVEVDCLGLEDGEGVEGCSIRALMALRGPRERALATLCETRDVGGCLLARPDQQRVLAWLRRKCSVDQLPEALRGQAAAAGAPDELVRANEMALLVSEYLPPLWNAKLVDALGLAEMRKSRTARATAPVYDAPESYMYGAADPQPGVAPPQPAKKTKPPTAKEKQLAEAAKRSKPITSFFAKRS